MSTAPTLSVEAVNGNRLPAQADEPRPIFLPDSYNYIAAFLTFRCPYRCSYCINRFSLHSKLSQPEMSGPEWIEALSRIETRDVPITFQGGEPGCHRQFIEIVRETARTRINHAAKHGKQSHEVPQAVHKPPTTRGGEAH